MTAKSGAGRMAVTHYEVLEYLECWFSVDACEIKLETGRTHQIRVHFAAIDSVCDTVWKPT